MRLGVFGGTFGSPPDPAFWNRNSPLLLARIANLAGLKIYFDCGDHDDFGFEAGAAALDSSRGGDTLSAGSFGPGIGE